MGNVLEAVGLVRRSNCGGNPAVWLMSLVVAQADFRSNDRDGNGVHEFWRGDITGLYGIQPPGSDERIRLLEISVAGADDRPLTDHSAYLTPGAKAGYWFRALLHVDEIKPSPDRFAFCAFSAIYDPRRPWTYLVDETRAVYRKDLGRAGAVDFYPADPVADGWQRIP